MTRYPRHTRVLASALALLLGLTVVAPPAFAAGPTPDPVPDPHPIATAAAAEVEAIPPASLVQAAPPAPAATPAQPGDKPFFKTTTGVVALALLAGSLGYMAYSMSDDRVKSPAK